MNYSLQRERVAVEHCGCKHTTNAIGEWVKYEPCPEHEDKSSAFAIDRAIAEALS